MVDIIRIMPYPPSFNRMAAKIIDPAIGASTCAFGNHKCKPYSGILIMKAVSAASSHIEFVHVFFNIVGLSCIVRMESEFVLEYRDSKATSRGRDPISV